MHPENILLNLPGYVFWKNADSVFLGANHAFTNALRLKCVQDIEGMTDHTLPGELHKSANHFIEQDKQALLGNKITTINIHCYADGQRRILLTEKSRLYDQDKHILGTMGNSVELNNGLLCSIAKLICQLDASIVSSNPLSYGSYLVEETYRNDLSVRESQCLFYLIRGKSSKKIASYLNVSQKTVETYVDRIKHKFDCKTKSTLIEKAINDGYITFIPSSLLIRQHRDAISE